MNEREKAIDKAPTFLFLVVEDNHLDDIGTCTTARDTWNTLHDMHSNYGLLHIFQLMRDFFQLKNEGRRVNARLPRKTDGAA